MRQLSGLDTMFTAHRTTVPDIEVMLDLLAEALATLKQRAGQVLRKAG